jgi:uncharacterized membrane protein
MAKRGNELAGKNKDEIPVEVAHILNDLPGEKKKQILQFLAISKNHTGPLPDGDTIRVYNEVIPNGGDRLMSSVEKQLDHRIKLETIGVHRTFNQSSTGQWLGFFIALVFGVIAWDLIRHDHVVGGSILGTLDLVALVTIFVTSRSKPS